MDILKHWHILFTLLMSWNLRQASSVEVCRCPDFRLSLSAVELEGETTRKLHGGFIYVAKQGSDVELKCELSDAEHGAVQSVVYQFHKTWELSSQPIFLSDAKYELCSDSTTSTCTQENVQYTQNPQMEMNIENGANHIYQCSAIITLKDGGEVKLWSHSIKIDVYYPPVKSPAAPKEIKTISEGKSMEKFECSLPASNPKTEAQWLFRKSESDAWELIDIPNDSLRGARLAIVEDKIEAGVTEGRGTLMLMIFNPTEDVGLYKCEGVYDTVFAGPDVFEITNFELRETGHDDSGALQLRPISAITSPKLVDQDSAVSFTVYARDTPGRGNYDDVTYTWQKDYTNIDFEASPDLELSNNGRTLKVNKLSDYVKNGFTCQMERSFKGVTLQTATSAIMGFKNDDVVIAPKFLSIPLTTKDCVEPGGSLEAAPNKAYMMSTAEKAGDNPKQILLKADSYKYYINDKQLLFLFDTSENYENEDEVGITEAKFDALLPTRTNDRCIYYQYLRAWQNQYQVVEVMKMHRPMMINGCKKEAEPEQIEAIKQSFDAATIAKDESQVTITFPESPILTTLLPLKMDLLDSSDVTLQTKNVSPDTADSCSSWTPSPVVFTGIPGERMTNLKLKIYFESSPDVALGVSEVDSSDSCDPVTNGGITPFQVIFPEDSGGTLECEENYVLPWAKSEDDTEGGIKCVNDGSGALAWAPDPKVDGFDDFVTGCVAKSEVTFDDENTDEDADDCEKNYSCLSDATSVVATAFLIPFSLLTQLI